MDFNGNPAYDVIALKATEEQSGIVSLQVLVVTGRVRLDDIKCRGNTLVLVENILMDYDIVRGRDYHAIDGPVMTSEAYSRVLHSQSTNNLTPLIQRFDTVAKRTDHPSPQVIAAATKDVKLRLTSNPPQVAKLPMVTTSSIKAAKHLDMSKKKRSKKASSKDKKAKGTSSEQSNTLHGYFRKKAPGN